MPNALPPSLLARLARFGRTPRLPEPADMGTAFGLEYILDERHAADSARFDPAPPPAHGLRWFARWIRRRSSR